MGIFGFFGRRREREAALPQPASDSVTRSLKGDGEPVGQPIGQTVPQQAFDWSGGTDLGWIFGLMQQAFQSGNYEITQGQAQVVNAQGSALRDEILGVMRDHGIDPENATANREINAADYQGMQEQIMQALQRHGVDVGGAGGFSIGGSASADGGGEE